MRGNPAMTDTSMRFDAGFAKFANAISAWDRVDLMDEQAVHDRIDDYFKLCIEADIRPGIVGLATAMGIDRRRLWEIRTGYAAKHSKMYGGLPQGTTDSIKKACSLLEALWEYAMQSGRINPVSGIFIGKNNFGYRDTMDYTISPRDTAEIVSPDELHRRLTALPEDD